MLLLYNLSSSAELLGQHNDDALGAVALGFPLVRYGQHPADCYLPLRSRCLHPGQQQGRRWPSSSSSWVRRMRRSRVTACLASSTQQMNSLRARGVMSFQASSAAGLAASASRRSPGSSCTTPPDTRWPPTRPTLAGVAPTHELVDEDSLHARLSAYASPRCLRFLFTTPRMNSTSIA